MTTDLETAARERGIGYFPISFTDLLGVQRASWRRGLCRPARHDAGRS
jgi:hypothetical protein